MRRPELDIARGSRADPNVGFARAARPIGFEQQRQSVRRQGCPPVVMAAVDGAQVDEVGKIGISMRPARLKQVELSGPARSARGRRGMGSL